MVNWIRNKTSDIWHQAKIKPAAIILFWFHQSVGLGSRLNVSNSIWDWDLDSDRFLTRFCEFAFWLVKIHFLSDTPKFQKNFSISFFIKLLNLFYRYWNGSSPWSGLPRTTAVFIFNRTVKLIMESFSDILKWQKNIRQSVIRLMEF